MTLDKAYVLDACERDYKNLLYARVGLMLVRFYFRHDAVCLGWERGLGAHSHRKCEMLLEVAQWYSFMHQFDGSQQLSLKKAVFFGIHLIHHSSHDMRFRWCIGIKNFRYSPVLNPGMAAEVVVPGVSRPDS